VSLLLAALLTLAQDPAPAPLPEEVSAPAPESEGYCTPRRLALLLEELSTKHPDLVRVESLGRSASGLELPVVTLARLEGDSPRSRPAVLLVAAIGPEDLFGTELALALVRQIVSDARREGAVRELLGRVVVHVVPCLNPDLRSQAIAALDSGSLALAPRRVELDCNFPTGWDPLAEAGAGPYPLSEPESRALAEYLVARPNVSACLRLVLPAPELAVAHSWPDADVQVQGELCNALDAGGLERIERAPGSFLRFAYGERGAFVAALQFPFERGSPLSLPRVSEIPRLARGAVGGVLHVARALPQVELSAPAVASLAPSQWSVDLELHNRGTLPSASARAREVGVVGAPELEVVGARLVAAAALSEGEARSLPLRGTRIALPDLGGSERLGLRLFLSADVGSDVRIEVRAPRAGSARVNVRLE
jgi:hypothetical protein